MLPLCVCCSNIHVSCETTTLARGGVLLLLGARSSHRNSFQMEKVVEGAAEILKRTTNEVFYNPAQCVNRDLSVAMIQTFINTRKREMAARKVAAKDTASKQSVHSMVSSPPQVANDGNDESDGAVDEAEDAMEKEQVAAAGALAGSSHEEGKSDISIFEALAASGLRSIRYYKELVGVKKIVVNDLDPNAVENIKANIAHNGVCVCAHP